MLRWLQDKAGVPFPHPRYAQVLTAGSAAQEASSYSLIGRRMLDPDPEDAAGGLGHRP
jgi:hypothetical protein